MSDKRSSEKSWLESALSRDLAKVEAPAELWERIQSPAPARVKTASRPLAWTAALALIVLGVAVGLRTHESHAAGSAELRSGDPSQIRGWVQSSTGLDVELPDTLAPSVRLTGARIVNAAVPSVELAYRVGDREATLLVARDAGSAGMRHADLKTVNNDGKITWGMHGQIYTLSTAGPEDAHVACLLCHAS
jgi:hypothetical protein